MAIPAGESRGAARQDPRISRDLEAALACHKKGRRDRAEELCRKVLRREPNHADALCLLGTLAHERGRHEYAVQLITQALAQLPNFADAHHNLGHALQALGRLDEAAEHYRAAIALKPDFAAAHSDLAAILARQGSYGAALESAERALELMPDLAEAHINRGAALAFQRRFGEAEAAYRKALSLRPERPGALSDLGHVLTMLKRPEEALEYLRKAAELAPGDAAIRCRIGVAEFFRGDPHASEAACRQAITLDLNSAGAWSGLGAVLRALGRFDEARSCLKHALDLDPELPDAYAGLAILGERADGGAQLQRLRTLLVGPQYPADVRIDAGFALGMLLDNADRYDEAFPCFAQANALYHEAQTASGESHDQAALRRRVDGLIASCTPELYAMVEDSANRSELPVFIVGMPRSGTSLVEQIAATHSRVSGAGELPDLSRIAGMVENHGRGRREEEMDPDFARRLADAYLERLKSLGNGAERVIDKMPDNILQLGLAAVLFPGARVIFCRRDSRDTCLSCYFCRFDQPIPWAYDLAECGLRALEIERLAEHWRRALPLRMLTVDYEALVADLEGESRRLIEFLGLDWEPACLDFYKTERPVLTASGWQVRQPLFTRSIGRWRKYKRHLGPLLEALGKTKRSWNSPRDDAGERPLPLVMSSRDADASQSIAGGNACPKNR